MLFFSSSLRSEGGVHDFIIARKVLCGQKLDFSFQKPLWLAKNKVVPIFFKVTENLCPVLSIIFGSAALKSTGVNIINGMVANFHHAVIFQF